MDWFFKKVKKVTTKEKSKVLKLTPCVFPKQKIFQRDPLAIYKTHSSFLPFRFLPFPIFLTYFRLSAQIRITSPVSASLKIFLKVNRKNCVITSTRPVGFFLFNYLRMIFFFLIFIMKDDVNHHHHHYHYYYYSLCDLCDKLYVWQTTKFLIFVLIVIVVGYLKKIFQNV